MKLYWVEGLFVPQHGGKKSRASQTSPLDVEPFSRSFWAETPDDALREATHAINGGYWVEGPRVAPTSEEKRMRASGAPELPGLFPVKGKKGK